MEKTKLKLAAVLAVLVVAVGGVLYVANRDDNEPASQPSTNQQTPQQPTATLTVSEDKKTVGYEGQTDKTALEVLKSLADVKTKQNSYGEFVSSINGVEADGMRQFWAFYVDGKLANEGAGTYKTTNGQKIEWRVEDIQ